MGRGDRAETRRGANEEEAKHAGGAAGAVSGSARGGGGRAAEAERLGPVLLVPHHAHEAIGAALDKALPPSMSPRPGERCKVCGEEGI